MKSCRDVDARHPRGRHSDKARRPDLVLADTLCRVVRGECPADLEIDFARRRSGSKLLPWSQEISRESLNRWSRSDRGSRARDLPWEQTALQG